MREVWHVAREYSGLAEAGGVKDAVHGLVLALARAGVGTRVVLPFYGFLKRRLQSTVPVASFTLSIPEQDSPYRLRVERVRVVSARHEGIRLLLVDSPRFADKRGVYTYTAEDEAENPHKKKGTGHWDANQMNLILQRSALETSLLSSEIPGIFHCHDGHAAFLPALMREDSRFARAFAASRAVVTIHNAGAGYHQEIWDGKLAGLLTGLRADVLDRGRAGKTIDPLYLAAHYATLTTVSEQYAAELLQEKDAELAGGLGRMLRERRIPLRGITNGIDPEPFDPRDPAKSALPFRFDPSIGDVEGKLKCRLRLFEALSLPKDDGSPLFAFIGRLTPQKGIDVLYGAVRALLSSPDCPRFIVLGQGEAGAERMFRELARAGDRLSFVPRYDPPFAKLLYAASDFLLIPSAFEPCGLTDFIAQIMGTIPVVHRVGGLVKVRDGATGFSYVDQTPEALIEAIGRCLRACHEDPDLLVEIRRRAFVEIFEDHTWDRVVRDGYIPLYDSLDRE